MWESKGGGCSRVGRCNRVRKKQELNGGMQKWGRKRGRDWHSDVNRERRAGWMKKLHTGGFLKSPFNMYEGSSIDSGSHKQATEQKGEKAATQVELKRALLLSADLQCVQSWERGDHPGPLFTISCLSCTQENRLQVSGVLSLNKALTKLQRCTKAQLHHYISSETRVAGEDKSMSLWGGGLTFSQGPAEHLSPGGQSRREEEIAVTRFAEWFLFCLDAAGSMHLIPENSQQN